MNLKENLHLSVSQTTTCYRSKCSPTWDEKEQRQVSFWEEEHGRIPRKKKKITFYFPHPKHPLFSSSHVKNRAL